MLVFNEGDSDLVLWVLVGFVVVVSSEVVSVDLCDCYLLW